MKSKFVLLQTVLSVLFFVFVSNQEIFAQNTFGSNNLAVLVAAASATNTTVSVVEINKTTASQSAIQTIAIPGTGTNAIRVSGSATSTLYAANSNDGSLFCFTGANVDGNTASNVNTLNPRAVVALNNAGTISIKTTYTGTSGNQTRCATSINNTSWFIGDQGGFYTNSATTASPLGSNVRGIKAFGGTVYFGQASSTTTTIQVGTISAASGGTATGLTGLTNNASMQDFYLIQSGSNGTNYDLLYIISSTSATAGTISKFSLVNGTWTANGTYTTSFGGFGLAAEKSGTGANLFITTGLGATTANSLIKLTDATGYNATISITTGNNVTLYTAATGTILKGVAFAPQSAAVAAPTIGTSGTLSALTTTYGTTSTASNISVTGSNLTADLTATAPTGFEVSSNGTNFGSTASFAPTSGAVSGTLYVRLAATAAVTGNYNNQNIILSSTSATNVNVPTSASGNAVSAKNLTIQGISIQDKVYDGNTSATISGTPAYVGLVNGESFSVTGTASATFASANVGNNISVIITGYTAPSSNYTVSQPTGLTANITAIPVTPNVTLSVSSNAISENESTPITVTATASSAVVGDQTILITINGVGITAGDYTLSSNTIIIPNGATTGSVSFTVVDDNLIEGTETATLTISSPSSGLVLGTTTNQTISITDNDFASVVITSTGGSNTVTEGGSADAYQIVLSAVPSADVTVTGTPDAQVSIAPSTVIFTAANWNIPQTVTVSAVDDNIVEGTHNGSISYSVSSADVAFNNITVNNVAVVITDNDVPHTIAFVRADSTANENAGNVKVWIKVTAAGNASGTVSIQTSNASNAISGADFSVTTSTLTIPANALLNQIFAFDININDDATSESDEYIICKFINATGINIATGGIQQHTLYIRDNDRSVPVASNAFSLSQVSSFSNGATGTNSAEISAYCEISKRIFIANSVGNKLDIFNFSNPASPTFIRSINLNNAPFSGSINSVHAKNGIIALALEGLTDKQANGKVVFVDTAGNYISEAVVGAMPDMITFNNAGNKVLTANEGEPNTAYTNDPEGSVSVIDISNGVNNPTVTTIGFTAYNSQASTLRAQGIRIYGLNATVAQDFEPEYITVASNDSTAWVTLQENNAIAEINLANNTITKLIPLGYKDHSLVENAMDVSDQTFGVNLSTYPVKGMYQPDAISNFIINGINYLITANEGDAREYAGFNELTRIASLNLDPTAFPNATDLKNNSVLGRLNATNKTGDIDNDGDIDEIYVYGARSLSIWNPAATVPLVYDSKNDFENITFNHPTYGGYFNMSHAVGAGSLKNRSDDKGPEPEGVTIGKLGNKTYAFVSFERIGGVIVYDVTSPATPQYVTYINNRQATTGDRGPEGIFFLSADKSPNGKPLVVISNEISSTVTTYQINLPAVSITAPTSVSTVTNNGCGAEGVILGNATATGGTGTLTISNNAPATFPVGSTTVTWTVTDEAGQTATATQLVTVSDSVKPTIYLSASGINTLGYKGLSSSQTPYVQSLKAGVYFKSLLSVPDTINGYSMVGIPDGLGAYDNGDGTFTLLMNHELLSTQGVVRAHGAKGSFVSNWVIRKSDMRVLSGNDLMTSVYGWNSSLQRNDSVALSTPVAFYRFCSGDLSPISAYYNAASGKGTKSRIYMHGEEGGTTGYQLATVASGADKGKSYILGKFNLSTNGSGLTGVGAWENALACPYSQDKTIVIGNNDGGTSATAMNNSVSVYIGTKQTTGSEVDKAGLTNGKLRFVKVSGISAEITNTTTRATGITSGMSFSLDSTTSTTFSRPEDGAWDPMNPSKYYFVTTDQLDQVNDGAGTQVGRSRLWRLNFTDITNPELGGTIDMLLNGTEGHTMFDNMSIDKLGNVTLLEDAGNADHNGKLWQYNIGTGAFTLLAKHDVSRFGNVTGGVVTAATSPFNKDEETSGVIDMSDIFGNGYSLLVDQAHYTTGIPAANVEGGQLLLMFNPSSVSGTASTAMDTVSVSTSGCTASGVVLGTPATGDNCSIVSVTNNAPATFPIGTTNVLWTVTDANGNTNTATQVVVVTGSSTPSVSSQIACDSYTWSVNGQTYTSSGSYTFVNNCATSILNLTINASTNNTSSATACDSYVWSVNGQTYTSSGSYTATSTNTAGCPHTEILNLTINASTSNTTSQTACDSYVWSVNGQTYTTSGSYTSVSGCATSILNLTVNASTSSSSDVTACNSYTLPWGNVVTTSGSYSNVYTSAGGCDSTVTVNVTINSSTNSTENVSICSSAAPYVWLSGNGLSYSTSGTYSFTYTNEAGCSSVSTLVLTVNSASSSSVSRAICSNQLPYTWNGVIFTAAGTQSVTLVNAAGCDSVVTMTLSVSGGTPTAVTAVTQTLVANNCGARVYRYSAGSVANASGYAWTLPTSVGGVGGVTVDSGDATSSRVILVRYASNNAAAASGDSIKVRAFSGCGSAATKGFKLSNLAWAPLAAPTITATTLVNNVCGARKVRYTTPVPATTAGAVGFEWSFVGLGLGANASIDSGTTESRVIVVLYTSNAAAGANDSVRVRHNYNNGCSYGAYGRSKITLGALSVPGSPTITATTVVNNICGGRKVRYSVPVTPAATALAGAATGYEWSFVGSGLGANASIDSGTVNSRVIVVLYTSNAAAGANDSVRCRYSSDCGYGANGKSKIGLGLLNTPAAPTAITITAVAPSVCGAKLYRYAAPALPVATTTAGAATGYEWSFTGTLGSDATIDSGDVTSRVIVVRYTSNAVAGAGDSVRVRYNSGCGYGPNKASKLTNVVTAVPLAPTAITVTAVSASTCGARVYRYAAPALPVASATAAAATGYEWSFTGVLGANATIDSGDVNSRIIVVRYTLNSAALAGDSVRVRYTSSCGYSARKASKLTNTALTGCPPPVAKVSSPAVFGVNVYPNPSNSLFNVQLSGATSEVVSVRVLDAQGRFIKSVRTAANQSITLGSDLKAGAYLLEVRQGNNVKTTRVLKF